MPTLTDLLVDFGKPANCEPMYADNSVFALQEASFDASSPDEFAFPQADVDFGTPDAAFAADAPDVEALVTEAVEKAEAELTARLEEGFAATLDSEREAHAQELERLRQEIGESAGAAINAQLAALEERLTTYTSEVVARLLGPILSASLQQKAIENLSDTISQSIRESGAVRIRVRGPLSLFEALQVAVGEHAGRLEFTETDGLDLEVTIDESLYETRLSEWSQSLSEALQ